AARQRRSPATMAYLPAVYGVRTNGCKMPYCVIEAAKPANASSSKCWRGWSGLGTMSPTATFCTRSWSSNNTAASTFFGIKASKPRPRPVLPMDTFCYLLSQIFVGAGAFAPAIVLENGLAKAGRFGQPHIARHHCFEQLVAKVIFKFLHNL